MEFWGGGHVFKASQGARRGEVLGLVKMMDGVMSGNVYRKCYGGSDAGLQFGVFIV